MIGQIARLLAALNSESSPRQLALAIALGMVVGLTPMLTLHNLLILLLVFVIRVNFSAFLLASAGFAAVGALSAGYFVGLGEALLGDPDQAALWTRLYQITLFKLAHLHHTLILGSLVVALVLLVPMYFISQWLIVRYRTHVMTFINKFKVVQTLKSSRLYQMYQSYSS